MSSKFEKIRKYYRTGKWTITQVRDAVVHEWITEEEFEIITSQQYE